MRVTQQTKTLTRRRILESARRLLAERGFDAVTTRDIADAAGIAAGTLFNYFSTKEAVLAALARELLEVVHRDGQRDNSEQASFEEELFAFAAAGLRQLKPLRKHLAVLLETALNPLATSDAGGQWMRTSHLEIVCQLAK